MIVVGLVKKTADSPMLNQLRLGWLQMTGSNFVYGWMSSIWPSRNKLGGAPKVSPSSRDCPERQTETRPKWDVSLVSRVRPVVVKWGRHVLLCRPPLSWASLYSRNNIGPRNLFGLARISQTCLSCVCSFPHFSWNGHRGIGWRLVWRSWVVFWEYSGNIRTTSEYQEYRSDIENIGATSEYQKYRSDIGRNAIALLAVTLLDAADGPLLKWYCRLMMQLKMEICCCEIVCDCWISQDPCYLAASDLAEFQFFCKYFEKCFSYKNIFDIEAFWCNRTSLSLL